MKKSTPHPSAELAPFPTPPPSENMSMESLHNQSTAQPGPDCQQPSESSNRHIPPFCPALPKVKKASQDTPHINEQNSASKEEDSSTSKVEPCYSESLKGNRAGENAIMHIHRHPDIWRVRSDISGNDAAKGSEMKIGIVSEPLATLVFNERHKRPRRLVENAVLATSIP